MKHEKMWETAAQDFIWDRPYTKLFQTFPRAGRSQWFAGGMLNYTKTIFEKNIEAGNAEKEAIVFYTTPLVKESYTYASLLAKVRALAAYFEAAGIRRASRVLILTGSRKEQALSVLALMRLGVQFGVLFSRFPPELIAALIKESGATHVIANGKLAGMVSSAKYKNVSVLPFKDVRAQKDIPVPAQSVPAEFPSFLCFSSGTTGERPKVFLKGTAGYFVGMVSALRASFFATSKSFYILNVLDFAFGDYPVIAGLFTPLSRGGKVIFFDFDFRLNRRSVIGAIQREKIETVIGSPAFFELPKRARATARIKNIILGGQKISPAVRDFIRSTFTGARLINAVGSQETGGYLVGYSRPKRGESLDLVEPLPGLEYKITHQEIFIKDTWPGLALPLNEKKRFAQRWRGRFFRVGDLVKKIGAGLEVIGRSDKLIKHRGRLLSLEYMEQMLETLPFIRKAKCLMVGSAPRPDIAVFVAVKKNYPQHAPSALEQRIRTLVVSQFGTYANPDKIIFVQEFPTSSSGKIMEQELRKKYA